MREWQIVTVALRWRSRCAIGLPTIALRPTTTARAPSSWMSYSASMPHDPERRAGDERRAAEVEPPGIERVEAVDVFLGAIASMTRCSSRCAGERQLHEDAVDRVVLVQLLEVCRSSSSPMSAGSRRSRASMPAA